MRTIALEEAFWLDGLRTPPAAKSSGSGFAQVVGPEFLARINKRIGDFTEYRIPDMDEHGVDMQVLSLTSPGIQAQPDPAVAVDDARRANDFLAEVVAERPTRFAGLAALPLQDPDAAVRELARAVEELGLNGALVNGPTLGHYLDEPQFDPVWAELERLDVPLYLHPHMAGPDDQWKVHDGYPELAWAPHRWAADTSGHALRLVYGKVFERHPGAKLILGHMGEFLPFQLARLDSPHHLLGERSRLSKPPSTYVRDNIYITTSGVCSPAALIGAVHEIGVDHVMFAVDYPYEHTGPAVRFLDALPLAPADKAKIAHRNAERILRIAPL
ncbi:MAG: amidohydrolase family protein [Segniliparus sp.]|uniref:amidohydrolase family protein n=1 Tax=Segniliparus sp. TaxID=2804064 RepID=UPI003F3E0442